MRLRTFNHVWKLPTAMNVILVTCGVVLAFICASSYGDHPYFSLYVGFSATMFFTVGLFNTYGMT